MAAFFRAIAGTLPIWLCSQAAVGIGGAQVVHRVTSDGLGFNVHLFAPASNAILPVIFFVTGFAGDTPIFTYSELLTMLADRGFIVVGLDRLGIPNYPKQAVDLLQVLRWAQQGRLQAKMLENGLTAVPDVEQRSVLMGHSEGNHVVGQALVDDCSVAKAWVMIDPVDGWDPWRFMKSEDLIEPGQKLNFTIPALILDNSLDPKPSSPLFPACDPYQMGTVRFFPAMRGPVWNINASGYGHLDCLNAAFDSRWTCSSDPTSDKAAYRAFLADTAALFFQSLLDGRQADLRRLSDSRSFGVNVTLKQDLQGLALEEIRAGCSGSGRTGKAGGPSLIV